MTLCLGIDPGRSAALALVQDLGPGLRPRLVGAWSVYGTDEQWWPRLTDSVSQAALHCMAADSPRVLAEVPGGGGKSRRNYRADTWLGLGRLLGRIEGSVRVLGWGIETIGSDDWPRWAGVRVGKQDGGFHRLQEAALIVDGAKRHLNHLPLHSDAENERRVAQAEAILIAVSGLLRPAEQAA